MLSDNVVPLSIKLLEDLGLFSPEDSDKRAIVNHRLIEQFSERKYAFGWVNMATTTIPVGQVLDTLKYTTGLLAPRTGHLGNWEDIVKGRAVTLDYNTAVCGEAHLGYPLIYDLNQTEDDVMQNGDWIYLPGSLVERGERTILPLFTWDGNSFVERSHAQSLCTPFVLTSVDGQLVPLVQVHRERMLLHSQFAFHFLSTIIYEQKQFVKELLITLIESIRRTEEQQEMLRHIADRLVTLDGITDRKRIAVESNGYRIDQFFYEKTEAFVDAILLVFEIAANPQLLITQIRSLPPAMPMLSGPMIELLSAILNTHFPNIQVNRTSMNQPCNSHVQWGAIGMAGYPPKKSGYFARDARYARGIHKMIIQSMPQIDPIFFILLPAAIFTVWPTDAYPQDIELIENLLQRVHTATDHLVHSPERLIQGIDRTVSEWIQEHKTSLSSYFVHRFSHRRSVLNMIALPEQSNPIEPNGFASLTLQQASILVGALQESFTTLHNTDEK